MQPWRRWWVPCRSHWGDLNVTQRHSQNFRNHLENLGIQPLTHLGTTVIEVDRTVHVHMHQRAGLVQRCQIERDAELHRHHG